MKKNRTVSCLIVLIVSLLFGGCSILEITPKISAKGEIVKFRNREPIEGVSIYTYEQRFDCGAVCNTYHKTGDSTITDSDGNFSFNISKPNLILSVSKRGYFGLYPGEGTLDNDRIKAGKNDFGIIPLRPYGEVELKITNTTGSLDSVSYKIYACSDTVATGESTPFNLRRGEITLRALVEAECTIDYYITLHRKGTKTVTKKSVFVQQGETGQLTYEY